MSIKRKLRLGVSLLLAVLLIAGAVSALAATNGREEITYRVTKQPTCTQPGTRVKMIWGDPVGTESIPALGHHFTNYHVVVEATETSPGRMEGKCSRCGQKHSYQYYLEGIFYEGDSRKDDAPEILIIESMLADLGYKVKVDGSYGRDTTNAVKEFQRKIGLDETGVFYPNLWPWLNQDWQEWAEMETGRSAQCVSNEDGTHTWYLREGRRLWWDKEDCRFGKAVKKGRFLVYTCEDCGYSYAELKWKSKPVQKPLTPIYGPWICNGDGTHSRTVSKPSLSQRLPGRPNPYLEHKETEDCVYVESDDPLLAGMKFCSVCGGPYEEFEEDGFHCHDPLELEAVLLARNLGSAAGSELHCRVIYRNGMPPVKLKGTLIRWWDSDGDGPLPGGPEAVQVIEDMPEELNLPSYGPGQYIMEVTASDEWTDGITMTSGFVDLFENAEIPEPLSLDRVYLGYMGGRGMRNRFCPCYFYQKVEYHGGQAEDVYMVTTLMKLDENGLWQETDITPGTEPGEGLWADGNELDGSWQLKATVSDGVSTLTGYSNIVTLNYQYPKFIEAHAMLGRLPASYQDEFTELGEYKVYGALSLECPEWVEDYYTCMEVDNMETGENVDGCNDAGTWTAFSVPGPGLYRLYVTLNVKIGGTWYSRYLQSGSLQVTDEPFDTLKLDSVTLAAGEGTDLVSSVTYHDGLAEVFLYGTLFCYTESGEETVVARMSGMYEQDKFNGYPVTDGPMTYVLEVMATDGYSFEMARSNPVVLEGSKTEPLKLGKIFLGTTPAIGTGDITTNLYLSVEHSGGTEPVTYTAELINVTANGGVRAYTTNWDDGSMTLVRTLWPEPDEEPASACYFHVTITDGITTLEGDSNSVPLIKPDGGANSAVLGVMLEKDYTQLMHESHQRPNLFYRLDLNKALPEGGYYLGFDGELYQDGALVWSGELSNGGYLPKSFAPGVYTLRVNIRSTDGKGQNSEEEVTSNSVTLGDPVKALKLESVSLSVNGGSLSGEVGYTGGRGPVTVTASIVACYHQEDGAPDSELTLTTLSGPETTFSVPLSTAVGPADSYRLEVLVSDGWAYETGSATAVP